MHIGHNIRSEDWDGFRDSLSAGFSMPPDVAWLSLSHVGSAQSDDHERAQSTGVVKMQHSQAHVQYILCWDQFPLPRLAMAIHARCISP